MTALRTTRPAHPRRRTGVLVLGLLAAGGCGGPDPANYRPTMTRPEPPPADRIGYDDRTRTLALPDPPAGARWMVRVSGEARPRPSGPDFRLPEGSPPDRTFVYYRRPGGETSGAVTVADILAARDTHASLPR